MIQKITDQLAISKILIVVFITIKNLKKEIFEIA